MGLDTQQETIQDFENKTEIQEAQKQEEISQLNRKHPDQQLIKYDQTIFSKINRYYSSWFNPKFHGKYIIPIISQREYNQQSKTLEQFCVIRGTQIKHGEYKKWNSDVLLAEQCTYANGKKYGQCKWWHQNGRLWSQCSYLDGKPHGESKGWYENGQLKWECTFVEGKLHGESNIWDQEGQLEKQCTYLYGIKIENIVEITLIT